MAVRVPPRIELVAERAGEEHRVGLADDDAAAHRLDRQVGQADVAEHDAVLVAEAAEPVGDRARLGRVGGDEADELAGLR